MTVQRRIRMHGFTLIEMVIVIAIAAILAALAGSYFVRDRSRATLGGVTGEVQALIYGARQSAVASGHDVIVMLFPFRAGQGPRVIVYEDAAYDFMTGGTVNFDDYDPEELTSGDGRSQVLDSVDLPTEIEFGPSTAVLWPEFRGDVVSEPLAAPLNLIDVSNACSFCADTGKGGRGAIRFDARGSATFYSSNAAKRPDGTGASFSLTHSALGGLSTFVVLSSTGAVQVRHTR